MTKAKSCMDIYMYCKVWTFGIFFQTLIQSFVELFYINLYPENIVPGKMEL